MKWLTLLVLLVEIGLAMGCIIAAWDSARNGDAVKTVLYCTFAAFFKRNLDSYLEGHAHD